MTKNYPIVKLLHHFNPSETALLDWLRPHIDDSLLEEIAAADYGYKAEEHFEALIPILTFRLNRALNRSLVECE